MTIFSAEVGESIFFLGRRSEWDIFMPLEKPSFLSQSDAWFEIQQILLTTNCYHVIVLLNIYDKQLNNCT